MKNKEKLCRQTSFISETSPQDGQELFSLCTSNWRTRASGSHGSILTTGLWWLCNGCCCCCCYCHCPPEDTFFSPLFSLLRLKLSSFCLSGCPPDDLNFLGFLGSLWNWLFSLRLFFKLWSPGVWFFFIPLAKKKPQTYTLVPKQSTVRKVSALVTKHF